MATDSELVAAWRRGDQRSGELLFERYYDAITRFFYNKAGDRAADLVQKTFLACVEGLPRMRDDARFRSYLFGIAHNLLRKYYRSKSRAGQHLDFEEISVYDLSSSPTKGIAARQEQRLLLEALRRIPIDYQVVLELFYWESMTAADIAEISEAPLGTVKTRIRRGRQLVEDRLAEIASSGQLLESTINDLEGWAKSLRDRLRQVQPTSKK
ncbi:MAG: sigma-70 family RNA polymerase sigma factor [Myxococcota bacterium]